MANAKKCDICGKLYEDFDSTMRLDGPVVRVVTMRMKQGSTTLDTCPSCVVSYAKMYSEHTIACEGGVIKNNLK